MTMDANHEVRESLGAFVRELNRREWHVRLGPARSFEQYAYNYYAHQDRFGSGFVIDGRPVPYFHPNRSYHDEIIWLNQKVYYDPKATFRDKLLNSAAVKFYGPSRTIEIITGHADVPGLERTEHPWIQFAAPDLRTYHRYVEKLRHNLDTSVGRGEKIWGTTELRTSLQTAARNHLRRVTREEKRPLHPLDMVTWIDHFGGDAVPFYRNKPTMEQSYEWLTRLEGVGNYYGYHLSSNLARMPGVGVRALMDRQTSDWPADWHGNLDENADYVVAGPGSMATLRALYPSARINVKTAQDMILAIRDDQEEFFGITGRNDLMYLDEATELGRFTTFGIEIALCQYNVFDRLRGDPRLAVNRAQAPISREGVTKSHRTLEDFF